MTQKTALKIIKTGANVFLTGEPGSGKSHTIREYVNFLRDCGIEPAITASTGIAATHIHGMTIHSWSGIGIKKKLSKYDIESIAGKSHVYKRINRAKVLIIDEISMLDAQTLESVDAVCREVKQNPTMAFGGMQVVFVGDFFQLPPVSKGDGPEIKYSFQSKTWQDSDLVVCYLSEQHRQDDKDYLSILSAIRKSSWDSTHKAYLNKRLGAHQDVSGSVTRLFSHNEDVDRINNSQLTKIAGDLKVFNMESSGKGAVVESLKRGCLSPDSLELKVGAVVMCTKNNPTKGFVNGTLGVVVEFEEKSGYPIIRTKSGKLIGLEPVEWALEENGKVLGRIIQIPLRLAWAITIHKSQGMSMDAAVMNLSEVFEYGQGYVALSRVRRLSGLYLEGYNKKTLEVHPAILSKDIDFKRSSAAARRRFEFMERDEYLVLHKNFVKAVGGKYVSDEDRKKNNKKTPNSSVPKSTYDITLDLLREKKTVADIAKIRDLKEATIIDHFHDLLSVGRIRVEDLAYLIPKNSEDREMIDDIHKAFKTLGDEKLKPVFEYFNGTYSYDAIRFARLFHV